MTEEQSKAFIRLTRANYAYANGLAPGEKSKGLSAAALLLRNRQELYTARYEAEKILGELIYKKGE